MKFDMNQGCDPKIFTKGSVIDVTYCRATHAEMYVRCLRRRCRQPVDWHYSAGRVVIKSLGDAKATAIWHDALKWRLAALRKKEVRRLERETGFHLGGTP